MIFLIVFSIYNLQYYLFIVFIVCLFITSIHGPFFVRARYCSVKLGLRTRHVHLFLPGPGCA